MLSRPILPQVSNGKINQCSSLRGLKVWGPASEGKSRWSIASCGWIFDFIKLLTSELGHKVPMWESSDLGGKLGHPLLDCGCCSVHEDRLDQPSTRPRYQRLRLQG